MQLLLSRSQHHAFRGMVFDLWAQFELTDEEKELINKYRVKNAVVTPGNTRRDLLKALVPAILITVVFYILLMWFVSQTGSANFPSQHAEGFDIAIPLGVSVFLIAEYLIYHHIREQIRIVDIINGRKFTCRSIISLLEKEEMLLKTAVGFRRFLEYMKTWGGKEAIPIDLTGVRGSQMIELRDEAA